jgi:acetyl esterase/lipase
MKTLVQSVLLAFKIFKCKLKYSIVVMRIAISLFLISCNFSAFAIPPIGVIDIATTATAGCRGWSVELAAQYYSVTVHFYVGNGNAQVLIGSAIADQPHAGLNSLGIAGNHGYVFTIPIQYRHQQVYAYAINVFNINNNPLLTNSGAYIDGPLYTTGTNRPPIGNLDLAVTGTDGCVGWALDENALSTGVIVEFRVLGFGANQPDIIIGYAVANLPRPDVNTATGLGGNHGFKFTIPTQYRYKRVRAVAQDLGGSLHSNLGNGIKDVNVSNNIRYSYYWDTYTQRILELDLYGEFNPSKPKKPLILMVHGGGFSAGDKLDLSIAAKELAGDKYIVASINYRLMRNFTVCTKGSINEIAWYWAMQDANAAIKYLAYNENLYSIDKNNVFLYGNSAGGITVLNLAYSSQQEIYYQLGGVDGENYFMSYPFLRDLDNSTHPPCRASTYNIKGVISNAGALTRPDFLQPTETIPVIMLHNPCDRLVNYNVGNSYWGGMIGNPYACYRQMWGSKYVVDKFDEWKSMGINTPYHKLYVSCTDIPLTNNLPDHGLVTPMANFNSIVVPNFIDLILNGNPVSTSTGNISTVPGNTLNTDICDPNNFICTYTTITGLYPKNSNNTNEHIDANSVEQNAVESKQKNTVTNLPEKKEITRCYPNPAHNMLTIELPEVQDSKLTISLYNSIGEKVIHKVVVTENINTNKQTLVIEALKAGLYFIIIQGEKYYYKTSIIKM